MYIAQKVALILEEPKLTANNFSYYIEVLKRNVWIYFDFDTIEIRSL